jgi:hypothetical protein
MIRQEAEERGKSQVETELFCELNQLHHVQPVQLRQRQLILIKCKTAAVLANNIGIIDVWEAGQRGGSGAAEAKAEVQLRPAGEAGT